MKRMDCPQEEAVTKAVRAGSLDASLQAHVAACEICRVIVDAWTWMQALADAPGSNRTLPDASLVYWRARLSEQEVEAEKAQDILDWAELAAGVVAIGFAGWGAWHWTAIQGLVTGLLEGRQLHTAPYTTPALAL